jgi:2-polyprenyl-3-methyl-5-hydroxy-6-metoxy-1,4-benzoquinol methylase
MRSMSFFPRDLAAPAAISGPAIEWEEPNCLLCSGRRWSQLVEAPDTIEGGSRLWFAVVQCQDCGLCFTNPRPNLQSIGQFYPPAYWPARAASPHDRKATGWRLGRRWFRFLQESWLLPLRGGGRLLDFGCGGGAFLQRMHRCGWQVTGLDVSAKVIQRIRSELGLRALVGSLPHPELVPESFDLVTMWHSLEHVHNPREILQQTHALLAPGGQLQVAVPNIDSRPFHWFAHCWYGLDLPRHLTHFSPRTLRSMLERTGFRVRSIRMVRSSAWLRWSARLAGSNRRASRWQRWLEGKSASRLATWYSYVTDQSDCIHVIADRVG